MCFKENYFLPQGLAGVHWIGCLNTTAANLSFDWTIAENVKLSDAKAASGWTPFFFRFRTSAANKTFMNESFAFEMISFDSNINEEDEALFQPPFGVLCPLPKSLPTANKTLPSLPASFSIHLRASNVNESVASSLSVDGNNNSLSIVFDYPGKAREALLPFTERLADVLGTDAEGRAVVDARSGLLHFITPDGVCKMSGNISHQLVGIIESVPNKTENVRLKDPLDILAHLNRSSFVYQGEGRLADGTMVEFFTAVKDPAAKGPIEAVTVFVAGVNVREIRFYGAAGVEQSRLELMNTNPLEDASIGSCLQLSANSSYVYVRLSLGMKEVREFGEAAAKTGLRRWLAELSDVSTSRLDELYLREDGKETLLLAVLGERWSVADTHMQGYAIQSNLTEALKKLNATIQGSTILKNASGGELKVII